MLSAEQVKPLLFHEGLSVRNLAAEYFWESWSRDAEIVPSILRACRQYGVEENLFGLSACSQLPISDESLGELIRMLAETTDPATILRLRRILVRIPGDVLRRRQSELHEAPNLSVEEVQRLERRIDLSGWPGAKLRQELEGVKGPSDDEFDDDDLLLGNDLVDALAKQEEPSEALIRDRLRSLAGRGSWQESVLVDLAGERRISRAIPLLLDCLVRNDEFLAERALSAIAKIGDAEAVRLIRPGLPDRPWSFKSHAVGVCSNVKDAISEQVILELLEGEDDSGIRVMACSALCNMFSERGVEIVRREILDGYDNMFICLEDRLLTVTRVLGIELPEADQWRGELEEDRRQQARRAAEMAELERKYEALKARGIDPLNPKPRPLNLAPQVDTSALKQLERPKVGRNETCPCGSGKKFKKCCGRSF